MQLFSITELFVCLIEPSTSQANLVKHILELSGVSHIETFQSGTEALAMIQNKHPHVVLSAMYLPDMTGTDVVYNMRAMESTQNIAFMLISSETNPRYLEPIRQAGAIAILPKPFTKEQLKRAFMATLDFINPSDLELKTNDIELEFLKILIVDDSRTARNYIRHVLNNLGILNIDEAENGKLAIPQIERNFYDLVITDYNMPEMDGEQLIEYIRTKSTQGSVPVLMVSSESDQGRLAAVEQLGISAICDKPFEPQTVKKLLQNILV